MDNSDVFFITEDIEKFIEITKEYSNDSGRINVSPRYSNQITVN